MIQFVTPDGQVFSTPHDFTPEQAKAMAAATTIQTYLDREAGREVITVLTRCGAPPGVDWDAFESSEGFWMDGNWIDWVVATHPGWNWARGSGEHDSGGDWFAQEHRLGDDFLWLAVGTRPHPVASLKVPDGYRINKVEYILAADGKTVARFCEHEWELLHACGGPDPDNNIVSINDLGDGTYEVDGADEPLTQEEMQQYIDYVTGDHDRVGCIAG